MTHVLIETKHILGVWGVQNHVLVDTRGYMSHYM